MELKNYYSREKLDIETKIQATKNNLTNNYENQMIKLSQEYQRAIIHQKGLLKIDIIDIHYKNDCEKINMRIKYLTDRLTSENNGKEDVNQAKQELQKRLDDLSIKKSENTAKVEKSVGEKIEIAKRKEINFSPKTLHGSPKTSHESSDDSNDSSQSPKKKITKTKSKRKKRVYSLKLEKGIKPEEYNSDSG